MTRFIQVTLVILAAILCAGLAACQSALSARVIDGGNLESTLGHTLLLDSDRIHLEDHAYLTVTQEEFWAAINAGWKPHTGREAGDCDDQASDILYHLRASFRGRSHSPAAGRVSGLVREAPHCAVWYVDGSKIKFIDPSSLTPLHHVQIQAERAFDK